MFPKVFSPIMEIITVWILQQKRLKVAEDYVIILIKRSSAMRYIFRDSSDGAPTPFEDESFYFTIRALYYQNICLSIFFRTFVLIYIIIEKIIFTKLFLLNIIQSKLYSCKQCRANQTTYIHTIIRFKLQENKNYFIYYLTFHITSHYSA